MHGVFRRLLTLVHWLGFICLVYWLITFLGISLAALAEGLNELKDANDSIINDLIMACGRPLPCRLGANWQQVSFPLEK